MVHPEPTSSEHQRSSGVPDDGAGGRHAARSSARRASGWSEPGITLVVASGVVLVAVVVTSVLGWVPLLVVVAVGQVLLVRGWVDYLEVPGAAVVAAALLLVAGVADLGIVVTRLAVVAGDRPDDLVQLAPALAVVFPVAVLAQLARRDDHRRDGALAGLVASCSGGVLVIGLALWLPLGGSEAGTGWAVAGVGVCAVIGIVVGLIDWTRGTGRATVLLLPVLLACVSAPLYVAARIVAG